MNAPYALDGSTLRWTSPPRSTLIGCSPALSAQDTWLTGFLTTGATVSLAGDRLTLTGGGTTINLLQQH